MSTTPPPGYGHCAYTLTVTGSLRTSVVTLGFRNSASATASGCTTAINSVTIGSGLIFDAALMAIPWSVVNVYTLINDAGVLYSYTADLSVDGAATLKTPSPNVSMVIRRNTTLAGRQFRGHMSMPLHSVDEDDIGPAGEIDAAVVTAWATKYSHWLTQLNSVNCAMHLIHGPNKLGVTPVPTVVSTLHVDEYVGTQRRRLSRV